MDTRMLIATSSGIITMVVNSATLLPFFKITNLDAFLEKPFNSILIRSYALTKRKKYAGIKEERKVKRQEN
jgi:hypothetical protein